MSRGRFLVVLALFCSSAQAGYEGIGRAATTSELKAWDIDVRPDFAGLPAGAGSVDDGEQIWIHKCTSCHGDFGDANHVFVPLVGNTTAEDIKTGHVAALKESNRVRTTFAKVNTVSTLWDYINRAMPWDAPKSLSADEVYAVLAYLLNLAEIVPADYVLSDKNIADVQALMPNRNGMTQDHGLWKVSGKADTRNKACMKNCVENVDVTSSLPAYALNAHGNLEDQMRTFGPARGRVTSVAETQTVKTRTPVPAPPAAIVELLSANGCMGCHGLDNKILGPGFAQISDKYKDTSGAVKPLADKIRNGGSGDWGPIPMPPQPQLSDEDVQAISRWLAGHSAP